MSIAKPKPMPNCHPSLIVKPTARTIGLCPDGSACLGFSGGDFTLGFGSSPLNKVMGPPVTLMNYCLV